MMPTVGGRSVGRMPHRGLVVVAGLVLAIGASGCTTPVRGPSASTASTSATRAGPSRASSAASSATPPATPSASASTGSTQGAPTPSVATVAPTHYTSRTIYRGAAKPDDLALDASGRLLFSDYTHGTVSRLEPDGTVTVLHRGLQGPEGLVLLKDGTLVVAEEKTNRIVAFAQGASTQHLLRTMPGNPTLVTCYQGVDGIAWDATTGTLVIPDAPTGTVYRLSTDGRRMSTIATGFVHPVGAVVDASGIVYVADECGGGIWRLTRDGRRHRIARVGMPDDLALDAFGGIVVTDVRLRNHSVTRFALDGSARTTLARAGLAEPQGLLIDRRGHIYVADDRANLIVELTPAR